MAAIPVPTSQAPTWKEQEPNYVTQTIHGTGLYDYIGVGGVNGVAYIP